jgi:phosphohistidine phosphatase
MKAKPKIPSSSKGWSMKTLIIMRHGKSSWKNKDLADHERPLAKRGLRDTRMMGGLIREKELVPQLVLTSTAVRATQTAQIFAEESSYHGDITALDSLYLAEAEVYIHELQQLPDSIERVMIIGHNPGLEYLFQILCGCIEAVPTGVVAYISLPIKEWSDLTDKAEGELIQIWRPKELRSEEEEKEKEEAKAKEKDKEKEKEKDKKKKKEKKPAKKKADK